MTTWRDTTSEHVQSDLDRLLNTVLRFADEMLRRHGEFHPYGVAMTRDGDEQVFAADTAEVEDPNPSEVLTSLVSGMSAESNDLRAAALVSDVTSERTDAVMVHLEHADSMAITVLLPYRQPDADAEDNPVEYDTMSATPTEALIWRRSLC
ncbi:hypothetical protein [Actinophytocola glycyrrhizae]|uniref:Uncharacterized protein n=1 Tax=Actinophytocola glycyrrhizae TaxID=2044873 RepID=A0ABV9SCM9_9PSEU